jgi:ppGpp synthetase/RelA/SpoT-type nucleotidyltranferase
MNTITHSPHAQQLLAEYRQKLPLLEHLSNQVYNMLRENLQQQGIELNALEHRVKTEASLAGKLERKGDKYRKLENITDLVGLRIVTFYTDDVDKVAAIVKHLFTVDWSNSVDKRKIYELNSFGYLSLHYICHLKEGSLPFEIQMRTALQHVWSAIEHDIGYKGAVKLPPEYRRQFSRLAGMLELADNEFSRLRTTMTAYRRQVQTLVKSGRLDEVALSSDSFNSYLELRPFDRLNNRIAAANQAELFPASPQRYLPVLEGFGFQTLGDVQAFVDTNADNACLLALSGLAVTDLDILAETIGLQNLCLVHILKHGGGKNEIKAMFDKVNGSQDTNNILAEAVINQAIGLPFAQSIPLPNP